MAKNDNIEFGNFHRNIMGTLSFDMKLPNMRKEQDFIVYPASEKTDFIMIQSSTRFGKINMTTGRGLMSQSHANGAYAVHMHIDKLVKFQLTDSQLEKLKEELAKTAGSSVGRSVVISDNSYADKFASGGYVEEGEDYEYVNTFGIDQKDFEKMVDAYHNPKDVYTGSRRLWSSMAKKYGHNKVTEVLEYIDKTHKSHKHYAKGGTFGAGRFASGGELVDKTIDHDGRYLHLVGNHRMLHIHLNNEGREMIMDERESGRGDEEIMYELFEDIVGNSTLMYHTDLGESGFGMTSSSGVTYDYGYDDNGDLVPLDDNAVVYVDNDSYRRSPVEELLEGRLIMRNSDFMARGGKLAGAGQFAKGGKYKRS